MARYTAPQTGHGWNREGTKWGMALEHIDHDRRGGVVQLHQAILRRFGFGFKK